ncbi:FkbM family methyltransferase [Brevundimonas sp.]|uniref:FkbM family methyltransferase n=1 Tax=Brevundimonas sp. TaxID=1871086 RepID=UPI002ED84F5A
MTESQAAEFVRQAYLWILGRAPDPAGLAHYAQALADNKIDAERLRQALLGSTEFQRRNALQAVDSDGLKIVVDPSDPDFGRVIAESGTWEPEIGRKIEEALTEGGVFVDIGANVGVMSFRGARAVGPTGRVIAFEPNPSNADKYLRGVIANGFTNITLFQIAAAEHPGVAFVTPQSNGKIVAGDSLLSRDHAVTALPADRLLADQPRIDLIKIDIEGFELQAIRGLLKTIARTRPRMLVEFNPLCLVPHGGNPPEALADLIFTLTDKVEVLHSADNLGTVASRSELMGLWARRDAEISGRGLLPPGWVHFDLYFQT